MTYVPKSSLYSRLAASLVAVLLALPVLAQTPQTEGVFSGNRSITGMEGDRWRHGVAVTGQKVASLTVSGTNNVTRRIRLDGGLGVRGENDTTTSVEEQTICLDADAYTVSDTVTPGTEGGDDYREGTPVENHVCQNEHIIPASDLPDVVWPTASANNTFTFASGSEPDSVYWTIVTIDNNCRSSAGTTVAVAVTLDNGSIRTINYTISDDDFFPCIGDNDRETDYSSQDEE